MKFYVDPNRYGGDTNREGREAAAEALARAAEPVFPDVRFAIGPDGLNRGEADHRGARHFGAPVTPAAATYQRITLWMQANGTLCPNHLPIEPLVVDELLTVTTGEPAALDTVPIPEAAAEAAAAPPRPPIRFPRLADVTMTKPPETVGDVVDPGGVVQQVAELLADEDGDGGELGEQHVEPGAGGGDEHRDGDNQAAAERS